jgi:hypothetical protein
MNWYLAKLVFQILRKDNGVPQFDEQLRLIHADEVGWAIEKARVLGWLEQVEVEQKGFLLEWRFVGVADICKVETFEDGAQISSCTIEPEDVHEYMEMIKCNSTKSLNLVRQAENLLVS